MTQATEPKKDEQKTKRQLRIEAADRLELEYEEDDGSSDVNSLQFRTHMAKVLEALGFENGLGYLADAIDRRVACGLEPLDVIELARKNQLLTRLERSRDEIAEKTMANQEAARLDKIKRDQAPPGRDRRNGPVRI